MSPLVRSSELHIACMRLAPGGSVGYHQATTPQLFAVVEGTGWVSSGDKRIHEPISAGGAVLWDEGEWHEVGSDRGLVAIVVEAAQLAPSDS
jgi:quercetin dioxygenase-like cupin family protein